MTPYMTVIVTAVLFSCLWQYFETRKQLEKAYIIGHTAITPHRRQICLAFAFVAMWLLPSLIVGTGGDYWNYRQMFYEIENGGTSYAEIGFRVVCQMIQLFTSNAQVLFFVFNFLSYALFFKCVKDYSVCFPVSVLSLFLVGMYFIGIPQMRQLLSIMLLFYGYRYIYRGNFWRFCIVVAAAMCFHITAIIAIPFYFILRQRFKFSYFFVMAVTLIMISMVAQPLLDILIATFYPRYMGTNTMYLFVKPFDIYAFLFSLPLIVLLVMYYGRVEQTDMASRVFTNATIWYVMLNTLCFWVPELFRILAYLNIANVISIPLLLKQEPKSKVRLFIFLILIIFYAVMLYYRYVVHGSNHLLPYVHVFNWKQMLSVN